MVMDEIRAYQSMIFVLHFSIVVCTCVCSGPVMSTRVSCLCFLTEAGNVELNVGRGRVLVANYKAIIITYSRVYSLIITWIIFWLNSYGCFLSILHWNSMILSPATTCEFAWNLICNIFIKHNYSSGYYKIAEVNNEILQVNNKIP